MDDHLVCYGCGLIFPEGDLEFDMEEDDPSGMCPECDSKDIESYDSYADGIED